METTHKTPPSATFGGDLWGGLTATLVALPSSIAFGVIVYSPLGSEMAATGALAGICGAAALGIVAPLIGRTGGLISAPCAPAAAVLSALVVGLMEGTAGPPLTPAAILPLLALTILGAAALQLVYGSVGGGRLIKFIPYPVVSGYLSGVALLIALGQLPKLFGLPHGTPLRAGLFSPELWQWQGLVVGVVTIIVTALAPRLSQRLPATIIGLAAGLLSYFALALTSPQLFSLAGNTLVIGSLQGGGSLLDGVGERFATLGAIPMSQLKVIVVPILTLSVLLSIDTLKTCVGLDALLRTRHHADRELIGQGCGNLASFFLGGLPGAGTMGPTLINVGSGGRTYRAGVIEGIAVLIAFLLLGPLIAWVPIAALAGILIVIAARMFDRSMFRLLRTPAGRLDFVVIGVVVVVALSIDLIAASGVGVGLAILLFIRDQIRGTVIRRKRYLSEITSKTRRLADQRSYLDRHGEQAVFCELQGNLFFGTTDQLFTQLEPDLRSKRFLLLDLRRVQSIDYTAAHLFEQMHVQLAERGGSLLFSGMPTDQRDFAGYLAQLGVVSNDDGGIRIFATLDAALEWMEEELLHDAGLLAAPDEPPLALSDFPLLQGCGADVLRELGGCLSDRDVAVGERIFVQGEEGDTVYLVRQGSVRILLPLDGGQVHHLATIGRGDFFGELAFLDRGRRSATAEAKETCQLYILSRERFDIHVTSFAGPIFSRFALALAERLRRTDAELRVLEER